MSTTLFLSCFRQHNEDVGLALPSRIAHVTVLTRSSFLDRANIGEFTPLSKPHLLETHLRQRRNRRDDNRPSFSTERPLDLRIYLLCNLRNLRNTSNRSFEDVEAVEIDPNDRSRVGRNLDWKRFRSELRHCPRLSPPARHV